MAHAKPEEDVERHGSQTGHRELALQRPPLDGRHESFERTRDHEEHGGACDETNRATPVVHERFATCAVAGNEQPRGEQKPGAARDANRREFQHTMWRDEREQQRTDALRGIQSRDRAKAYAVREQYPRGEHAKRHAERECAERNLHIVGDDRRGHHGAEQLRVGDVALPVLRSPNALVGSGIYLGLAASSVLVGFGLTIVIKRASQPYVVDEPDDDV